MSGRRRGTIGSRRRWRQEREDARARRTRSQNWEFIGNLYFKELTRADEASEVGRHGGTRYSYRGVPVISNIHIYILENCKSFLIGNVTIVFIVVLVVFGGGVALVFQSALPPPP